jgi:hypothetical protein
MPGVFPRTKKNLQHSEPILVFIFTNLFLKYLVSLQRTVRNLRHPEPFFREYLFHNILP